MVEPSIRHSNPLAFPSSGGSALLFYLVHFLQSFGKPAVRWLFFVLAAPLLLLWQVQIAEQAINLDHQYTNTAGTGAHREERFVYFLRHLNLYPLATTIANPVDSKEEANRILSQHGDTLRTEVNHTARYGEHMKTQLLLLDSLRQQSTRQPSYHFANGWAFRIALLALLAAFCWAGNPLMGGGMVLLLGSDPFQLHEVYARENVHGWVITTALFLLALMTPILRGREGRWYPWFAVAVASLWLGSVVHVRSEPVVMLLSVAVALLLSRNNTLFRRLILVVGLLVGYSLVSSSWHDYFTWKIQQSSAAVREAGGVPYDGPREFTHQFWHPLHLGLSDFDQKYGFKWDDRWAARKLFPILRERGVEIPPWDGTTYRFMDAYHDEGKRYYKALLLIPGFYELSRDSYFAAIANDPLWYGKILLKRGWALLDNITPVAVEMGHWRWALPLHGLWLFPVVWLLWKRRELFLLQVVLFTLPTCLPAFVIYSGRGMTYMAIYHVVALAVVVPVLVNWGITSGFAKLAGRTPTNQEHKQV